MTDPIEDLIRDLPLKGTSESCDQKILAAIRTAEPTPQKAVMLESNLKTPTRETANSNFRSIAISVAASLLIGFFLGSQLNGLNHTDSSKSSGKHLSSVTGDPDATANHLVNGESGINKIELIENESETFIVSERLQWKNQTPIRRVETVTNKKVFVTNDDAERQQIEVPIRKVIYTLVDSI